MSACEQRCGREAVVYAIDPMPGGWGGRYCWACAEALRFRITDRLCAEADDECFGAVIAGRCFRHTDERLPEELRPPGDGLSPDEQAGDYGINGRDRNV